MRNINGFTLLEILIVVIIIGLLATLAIPTFKKAIWKARFAEVYRIVGMIERAEERHYSMYGTWLRYGEGFPRAQCLAGLGIPTGSTQVQQELMLSIPENCFFRYLIYPNTTNPTSTNIFFRRSAYWAWYYNYRTKTWRKYSIGDGGPAREYFNPPQ